MLRTLKTYLARPENGAGLLFVLLALSVVRLWLLRLFGIDGAMRGDMLFNAWTLLTFAISAWFAFLLLRRRLQRRALRRVLLVTLVHVFGAVRFYDGGMALLSMLPLFALVPALLFPRDETGERDSMR